MIIKEPSFKVIELISYSDMLNVVEEAYRICYASEPKGDAEKFIQSKIALGHHSCLEHITINVIFEMNRSTSHQLVRHRIVAISQQSQRYCNYSKEKFGSEVAFIDSPELTNKIIYLENKPNFIDQDYEVESEKDLWIMCCEMCEWVYMLLVKNGVKAEVARGVLPNDAATKLMFSCNLREWRHVLNLRAIGTTGKPQKQIQELMVGVLNHFVVNYPAFFRDLLN